MLDADYDVSKQIGEFPSLILELRQDVTHLHSSELFVVIRAMV